LNYPTYVAVGFALFFALAVKANDFDAQPIRSLGVFFTEHPMDMPEGSDDKDGLALSPTLVPLRTLFVHTGKTRMFKLADSFIDIYQKTLGKEMVRLVSASEVDHEVLLRDPCSNAEIWIVSQTPAGRSHRSELAIFWPEL
jgi:hypothetical protein